MEISVIREVFHEYRRRALESSRWERLYPIHMGPCRESWTLSLTLSPDVGDVARFFPVAVDSAYADEGGGRFVTSGREVRLQKRTVVLRIEGTRLPAWDGGVQDAILRTLATELRPFVVGAVMDRWTDTPFEDLPVKRSNDEARALVVRLAGEAALVLVEWELDYFSQQECANPDLEVHFHDTCRCYCTSARWHPANRTAQLPAGAYKARAAARVCSQPLARWPTEGKRSNELLWLSPTLPVELRAGTTYRFAVGLAKEHRVLTNEERRFIESPAARIDSPREILHLRLLEAVRESE